MLFNFSSVFVFFFTFSCLKVLLFKQKKSFEALKKNILCYFLCFSELFLLFAFLLAFFLSFKADVFLPFFAA